MTHIAREGIALSLPKVLSWLCGIWICMRYISLVACKITLLYLPRVYCAQLWRILQSSSILCICVRCIARVCERVNICVELSTQITVILVILGSNMRSPTNTASLTKLKRTSKLPPTLRILFCALEKRLSFAAVQ